MIQELLDVFDDSDMSSHHGDDSQQQDQLFMTLSVAAISEIPAPRTLCLSGAIQGTPVTILVDSGSSHSFVSDSLASQWDTLQELQSAISVRVANGAHLCCTTIVPQAAWTVEGYEFSSDLRVLPLSTYDIILGMNWLEQFSPMQVD